MPLAESLAEASHSLEFTRSALLQANKAAGAVTSIVVLDLLRDAGALQARLEQLRTAVEEEAAPPATTTTA